jgi:hypothetical protein
MCGSWSCSPWHWPAAVMRGLFEFGMSRDSPRLKLFLGRYGPRAESTMRGFSSWCLSDSLRIHAYGGRRFRATAAEGIEPR